MSEVLEVVVFTAREGEREAFLAGRATWRRTSPRSVASGTRRCMMCAVPAVSDLDRLVARAQRGDALALEAACARARPMLVRHARRLLGGAALAEDALVLDHEPLSDPEWRLIEQELHLACTLAVLVGLRSEARRLYLLGEVLGLPDRVGAEVTALTPAAYRKRLERTRRTVADTARGAVGAPVGCDSRPAVAADELDAVVRLGELHRARTRSAGAQGAVRALARVAPTLAA